MASRNGSPGSHSADTVGRCCTRRSTASQSARRSRASRSAYSSGGPVGETQTGQPPRPSRRLATMSPPPTPKRNTMRSEELLRRWAGSLSLLLANAGEAERKIHIHTFIICLTDWLLFPSDLQHPEHFHLLVGGKFPTRRAWTAARRLPYTPPPGL